MDTYLGFPARAPGQPVYLTIGNFDGVHRGHQMLVCELAGAAHAARGLAGLLTFEPHPLAVLRPQARVARLTSNEERAELLASLGLDFVLVLPFTRATADTTAADFMADLTAHLPLAELWIGPDFALGRGREGNAARLAELGRALGYRVHIVPPYDIEGEPVRSSRVRSLLTDEGAVERAAAYLGRPYRVWGEVVRGAQRGRTLGFPTANLALPAERLVPAFGVYACWAWLDDRGYPAVVNIGVRPSFDNGQPSVEAYLLDFEGDLYGETLGLSFIRRLRGEKKFENIASLAAQIRADAESARAILADPPTHAAAPGSGAWDELTHTADWAIRVRGADPAVLFASAALAMYTLQDADLRRPVTLARAVSASGDGLAELLVAWLNRLLLGQELGGEMYTRFEIQEISDRGVRAVAYGYAGAPSHTGIKAVTYYDLDVAETPAGWHATVTFDV
jgi:riboflavin kinase/FMN adenylyltransferase